MGRDIGVRIGVHSGPLVAGVVGGFRFVYDLWGSTVNLASRIEEAGNPNKITVSQAVIDRIGDSFGYQRQGRVRLRGVGPTILYSIEGRKAGRASSAR
jgi:ammonium transporter, Amt family